MVDRDAQGDEETTRDYFKKGFTYDEILALLDKYHGIRMSIATLKRRIKEYGLKRRNVRYDLNSVRNKIRSLLDVSDCVGDKRHIFGTLSRCKVLVFPVLCSETFAVMFTNFCRDVQKLLP